MIEKNSSEEHVLSANLLISGESRLIAWRWTRFTIYLKTDTSEYPSSHSVFCYSPDGDLSAKLQRIIDEIAEEPPRSLGETVLELMASIGRVIGSAVQKTASRQHEAESEDEDGHSSGAEDYDAFEDYDDIAAAPVEPDSIMAKLQE